MLAEVGRKFVETGITEPTLVKDSPQKVAALAEVTNASGKFPKPLVCLVHENEWVLLDGYHRLAGMLMQENVSNFPFDTWIGTHDL